MTPKEKPVTPELLRPAAAAERLGIPTRVLVRLMHERRIPHVMKDGIAHVPAEAVDQFRSGNQQ
jgi:excisionase family DNA binding protein